MQGNFTKTSDEFKMFGEFYNIVKQFYIPENTTEYFGDVVDTVNDWCERYKGNEKVHKLAAKLGVAYINFLEEVSE